MGSLAFGGRKEGNAVGSGDGVREATSKAGVTVTTSALGAVTSCRGCERGAGSLRRVGPESESEDESDEEEDEDAEEEDWATGGVGFLLGRSSSELDDDSEEEDENSTGFLFLFRLFLLLGSLGGAMAG